MKALLLLFIAAMAIGYFIHVNDKTAEKIGAAAWTVEGISGASKLKAPEEELVAPVAIGGYLLGSKLAERDNAKTKPNLQVPTSTVAQR